MRIHLEGRPGSSIAHRYVARNRSTRAIASSIASAPAEGVAFARVCVPFDDFPGPLERRDHPGRLRARHAGVVLAMEDEDRSPIVWAR